jgi:hypothetical protein
LTSAGWAREANAQQGDAREHHLQKISKLTIDLAREKLLVATSAQERCSVIITALNDELQRPATSLVANAYLTSTEVAQMKYLTLMIDQGEEVLPELSARLPSMHGRARQLVVIAMTGLGNRRLDSEVLEMARGSPDPILRMLAVRSLSRVPRDTAMPGLRKSLKDAYCREAKDDVGTVRVFPVREEAVRVLKGFGVTVERSGDEFRIVE